jgi:amicyanin
MALIVGGAIAIATHKSASKDSMSMPTSGASSSSAAATATNAVTIQSYAFGPKAITVKAGTTVTWTNTDGVKHTVTSDSGNTLKSDLFGRGETFSYTFMTAGTYSYHCEPHPYMKGTVVVTN